ncbi:MAG: O-linked N-acetylglucosamine transferase, SPINDLY family protein [Gammaproteobacteria bacterium]
MMKQRFSQTPTNEKTLALSQPSAKDLSSNKKPERHQFTVKQAIEVGMSLQRQGRYAQAASLYEQVLIKKPSHPDALQLLGLIKNKQNDTKTAIDLLKQAIQLKPKVPHFHSNLAQIYFEHGYLREALLSFKEAAALEPNNADHFFYLGLVYSELCRYHLGIMANQKAIELRPDFGAAFVNLGVMYQHMGKLKKAYAIYEQALTMVPKNIHLLRNFASVCNQLNKNNEAIVLLEKALQEQPLFYPALRMLLATKARICDWRDRDKEWKRALQTIEKENVEINFLHTSLIAPLNPQQRLQIMKKASDTLCKRTNAIREQLNFQYKKQEKPILKIGYVSADYHAHATMYLIQALFKAHNRKRFHISAYSLGIDDKSMQRRSCESDVDSFIELRGLSYVDCARKINNDNIDILIDLKGYTLGSCAELFALRPAPIQVNYLGFPCTMGASFMDYFIGDKIVSPLSMAKDYAEKLVIMPHCYQVNDTHRLVSSHIPTRKECGLPENAFVFASFSNSYKIDPEVFSLWMKILKRVPNSVLWLYERYSEMVKHCRYEAEKCGIESERIIFAKHKPIEEHLARHACADLMLDTLLVNAHTTASDALWMGVPMITCPGDQFANRVASSLLHTVGLDICVVSSVSDYEELAVHLATHPKELNQLSHKLKEQVKKSPLFNTEKFVKGLEWAYEHMWRKYVNDDLKDAFEVETDNE